jgi:hypothetical protein
MQLSPHFTLSEMTKSQTAVRRGINNFLNPEKPSDAEIINNLKRLCLEVLEPVREAFEIPFSPSSGYRSPALNTALGSKPSSQHVVGQAVDFELPGIPNLKLARWVRDHLDYDQLILEFHEPSAPSSGWVHVSLREAGNRRRALTINKKGVFQGLLGAE